MNSSGKKRGLAFAATTALAIAGLPFLAGTATAATTINGGQAANIVLYSQQGVGASTQNDGSDQTVRVLAGVRNVIGGEQVHSVRLSVDGVEIAETGATPGATLTQGVASFDVPLAAAAGATLLVEALDNFGNVLDAAPPVAVPVGTARNAVHLNHGILSEVGEWNGEIVLRGTASANGAVSLSVRGPENAPGAEDFVANAGGEILSDPNGNGIRTFAGTLDVSSELTAADNNVAVIRGLVDGAGSDDVTVVKVYEQNLANVTKASVPGYPASVGQGNGVNEHSRWTFKAVDQKGNPIHGLRVFEATASGTNLANPDALGGAAVGHNGEAVTTWNGGTAHTDVNGEFTVNLSEATIDNARDLLVGDGAINGEQTVTYVFDVNGDGNYDEHVDYRFSITQTRYDATAKTVEITNRIPNVGTDVLAMDDDEASFLRFLVKDAQGNPRPNETVAYRVNSGTANGHTATTAYTTAGLTNAEGWIEVPFNAGAAHNNHNHSITVDAYVNNDGIPGPSDADAIAATKSIEIGESMTVWKEGARHQVQATTDVTETGFLQLESGTPLANRRIAIDFASGSTPQANAHIPATGQPASVIVVGDSTAPNSEASVRTGADGSYEIKLDDPESPNGQELNSELEAADVIGPNNLRVEGRPSLFIDWLRSLTPATMEIRNSVTNGVDSLRRVLDGANDNLQPGKLGAGYVLARNADGVILTDAEIPVTINEGHFVKLAEPLDPAAVVGQNIGEWSDGGKSVTIKTGDRYTGPINGANTRPIPAERVHFAANIERHEGFDDDGLVNDKIVAGTGSASFEHDFRWNTIASMGGLPLNNGSFSVELSADQESPILPKARAGVYGHDVFYDVVATDQFGNRTKQSFNVLDNTPLAHTSAGGTTQFKLEGPALTAWADSATNQEIEVELNNSTKSRWIDNPINSELIVNNLINLPAWSGTAYAVTPDDVQVTTAPINWYNLDLANSVFTLGQAGADTVQVGSTVNEIAKAIDQEGAPIAGLGVTFTRSGPADLDSDGNGGLFTDVNGTATYTFAGGKAGVATTTASFFAGGTLVSQVEDKVTFDGGTGGVVRIDAKVTGKNNGAKADKLKVVAGSSKAAGAKVELYKRTGSGDVLVGTKTLNKSGNVKFKVADTNGKKATKYYAVVAATDLSTADRTAVKKVK